MIVKTMTTPATEAAIAMRAVMIAFPVLDMAPPVSALLVASGADTVVLVTKVKGSLAVIKVVGKELSMAVVVRSTSEVDEDDVVLEEVVLLEVVVDEVVVTSGVEAWVTVVTGAVFVSVPGRTPVEVAAAEVLAVAELEAVPGSGAAPITGPGRT